MKQLLDAIRIIEWMANCEIDKWYIRLKDGTYLLVYDKDKK